MKRRFVIVAAVTCLLFIAGGLNTTLAQTKTPYKIGFIVPLTGYLSWLGEYMKKGAEVKVEMINRVGGVNGRLLEVISYDDQSSPETGTRHAQRLISRDEVVAIMGTGTAVVSGAVSSVANKSKVPAIIQSGYALSDKETFTFNNAHPTEFAISRPMMYFQKKGISRVALLMPIGLVIFFMIMLAEMERPPFDLREADSELIAGWLTDVSAPYYGLALFLDYARIFAGSLIIAVLFFGGYLGPSILPPLAWTIVKVVLIALFIIVIRITVVRMRIDRILHLGWVYLTPLAVLNLLLTFVLFIH